MKNFNGLKLVAITVISSLIIGCADQHEQDYVRLGDQYTKMCLERGGVPSIDRWERYTGCNFPQAQQTQQQTSELLEQLNRMGS